MSHLELNSLHSIAPINLTDCWSLHKLPLLKKEAFLKRTERSLIYKHKYKNLRSSWFLCPLRSNVSTLFSANKKPLNVVVSVLKTFYVNALLNYYFFLVLTCSFLNKETCSFLPSAVHSLGGKTFSGLV